MARLEQRNIETYNTALAWVDHSHLVISKNLNFSIQGERMLANKHGYALTGDAGLSASYNDSKLEASSLLAELSVLMKDNPAQLSRLGEEQYYFLELSKRLNAEPLAASASNFFRIFYPINTPVRG